MDDLTGRLQSLGGLGQSECSLLALGTGAGKTLVREGNEYALILHPDVAARMELGRPKTAVAAMPPPPPPDLPDF